MHILDHLTEEHRKAERMLRALADTDPGAERNRLLGELDEALSVHMAVEEMFVYPIAQEVLDDEKVEEAEAEHDLARDGIRLLRERASEPGFGAVVDMVTAGIGHHVEEEETELFPDLRQKAADRLAGLEPGELEQEARASRSARTPRGRTGDDDDGETRDELYARAQAADIAGRSQMTKDELAAALRAAE